MICGAQSQRDLKQHAKRGIQSGQRGYPCQSFQPIHHLVNDYRERLASQCSRATSFPKSNHAHIIADGLGIISSGERSVGYKCNPAPTAVQ